MVDHKDRPDRDPERETVEGVRIIGAAEAAEAVERGDVAGRLSEQKPVRGDQGPPSGARPALRFPLDVDSDPADLLRGPTAGVGPSDDPSPSGTVELPHWTDPPTGEVPAVLAGDEDDDMDAWSSFATSSPTRWRGADDDWDDTGEYTAALFDDAEPLGALDQSDRPTDDDLFSFDDLDEVVSRRTAESGTRDARALTGETRLFEGDRDPTLEDFDDEPVFSERDVDDEPEPHVRRPRRSTRRPSPVGGPLAHGADDGVGGGRDVPTAVAAGVGIAVVALICFALGPAVVAVLATVVIALAAVEYF